MRLKTVRYESIGKTTFAIEVYEDYSVRFVKIENGRVNYILNGGNDKNNLN